jgi:uncharacterized protein (TIGR02145 family)
MFYKSILNVVAVAVVAAVFCIGCVVDPDEPNNPSVKKETFTDSRDGKSYKWVEIGTQKWMAENLNYAAEGSKCYEDNPSNCAIYGRLYNWDTALTACPSGWHLPTDAEWTTLENAVGSSAGKKLKSTSGWEYYSDATKGTDNYGFSALPGGTVGLLNGSSDAGEGGWWWSATESRVSAAWYRNMYHYSERVDRGQTGQATNLLSVRCVQD